MYSGLNKSATHSTIMEATAVAIPPAVAEALGYMQRPVACPEDIKAKILALRVPSDGVTGTRMNTNWRSGPAQPSSSSSRGGGAYRPPQGGHRPQHGGGGGGRGQGAGGYQGIPQSRAFGRPPVLPAVGGPAVTRFGNKGRTDVTTEERMMDRIRDKMNKFSMMTYDATKTWLSQLLDSGETEFLDEFITLVFEKAAAEPTFCHLYARLITDLRAAFPHLSGELQRIFRSFMSIFEEAADEPAIGSVEYNAFVAMRERRRNRRGYATFIGEAAQNGAFSLADVTRTCDVVLDGLHAARLDATKGQLTEEYAECLSTLMSRCKAMLMPATAIVDRIRTAQKKEETAPGLTNKARFCLMDITDAYSS
jgi:hypothetical protein